MYHHPLLTLAVFVAAFTTIEASIATAFWLAAACYFSLRASRARAHADTRAQVSAPPTLKSSAE